MRNSQVIKMLLLMTMQHAAPTAQWKSCNTSSCQGKCSVQIQTKTEAWTGRIELGAQTKNLAPTITNLSPSKTVYIMGVANVAGVAEFCTTIDA